MFTSVIIVAAGSGTRLGYGIPKAAVPLGEGTILSQCLAQLPQRFCDQLVVVLPAEDHGLLGSVENFAAAQTGTAVSWVVGGESRAASVANGMAAIDSAAEAVLIHDAARPLTPEPVWQRVKGAVANSAVAVIPVVPVADTTKEVKDNLVLKTVDRSTLAAVQTPQGFNVAALKKAQEFLSTLTTGQAEAITDEALLMETVGQAVTTVAGSEASLKITTEHDHRVAQLLLEDQLKTEETEPMNLSPRTGIGTDVHAFDTSDPSRECWVAGLLWPGVPGLSGHSDGDVATHAACDALFSAAGIGDLGAHFGVDRPELKDAKGADLLAEAARLVRAEGYQIGNIAIQVVGNQPKIGKRREEAQKVLSKAAGAPVSISGTTSDGLGFTGKDEGLFAVATALIFPLE